MLNYEYTKSSGEETCFGRPRRAALSPLPRQGAVAVDRGETLVWGNCQPPGEPGLGPSTPTPPQPGDRGAQGTTSPRA